MREAVEPSGGRGDAPHRVAAAGPMGEGSLEFRFEVSIGIVEAFEFFGDARNLNRVAPPWFRFEIVSPEPIRMAPGTRIDYRLRWRLWTFDWQSVVTRWQPPRLFVYEQGRGPYRYFRHEHLYRSVDGGTEVTDRVVFDAPGGALVRRWIVEPELRRIFAHRARAARRLNASL